MLFYHLLAFCRLWLNTLSPREEDRSHLYVLLWPYLWSFRTQGVNKLDLAQGNFYTWNNNKSVQAGSLGCYNK